MVEAAAREPRYITTPIYYVNGVPHIGHVYTSLACDVVARFSRLDGHDVFFLTGTDEHGQKVEQSARISGESPLAFADRVSASFHNLLGLYNFSCDEFIRTTEPRHAAAARALWRTLRASGDIYLGAYEGWYSVRDEAFYTEEELVDGMAPTGAEVEWVAESSYFFRLSRWQQRLVAHIEENPDFIMPVSRRNEVLAFLKQEGGLRDLSISRTTFSWGIPVPGREPAEAAEEGAGGDEEYPEGHIMYVWLDALTNYLTAAGYPEVDSPQFGCRWPAYLHMVGKDILRFHAVYWPAFLMAANLPLPKRLFAHGWWLVEGAKMSKSVGNVIDPVALVEKFGVDQVRYFMINEVSFGGDGDFSDQKLIDCANAKLSNELGNLVYRTTSFAYKQCDKAVPSPGPLTAEDEEVLRACDATLVELRGRIDRLELHRYTQALSALAQIANKYIDVQAPWALKKTDQERMKTVLWVLLEALRHLAICSAPVTPATSDAILDQLSVAADKRSFADLGADSRLQGGTPLPPPSIVTPRIEVDEAEPPAEAAAAEPVDAPPSMDAAALAALEGQIAGQGDLVRRLKGSGSAEEVGEAVAELLALKAQLPDGHELKGGKKKKEKKKKKAKAA